MGILNREKEVSISQFKTTVSKLARSRDVFVFATYSETPPAELRRRSVRLVVHASNRLHIPQTLVVKQDWSFIGGEEVEAREYREIEGYATMHDLFTSLFQNHPKVNLVLYDGSVEKINSMEFRREKYGVQALPLAALTPLEQRRYIAE